jgi:hypothetical protein
VKPSFFKEKMTKIAKPSAKYKARVRSVRQSTKPSAMPLSEYKAKVRSLRQSTMSGMKPSSKYESKGKDIVFQRKNKNNS